MSAFHSTHDPAYSYSNFRVASLVRSLSAALSAPNRPSSPPSFDIHGVNVRQLAHYTITTKDVNWDNRHIGDILSLVLVPSAWPTPGLPSFRQAAGSAAKSSVCGKVWKGGELAYKCKTCERDSTCVVCVQCFHNADHTGHDFAMIRTGDGCCDCGDPQAWRVDGFCRNHPGACSENEDPARELDPSLRRNLIDVVQAVAERVLLLCMEMCQEGHGSKPVIVDQVYDLLDWLLQIVHCGDGIRRVVGLCLADPAQWPSSIISHAEFSVDLSKVSWLRMMLEIDGGHQLSPRIQDVLHKVYFQLITDLVFKKTFLKMFVDNYESYLYAQIERSSQEQGDNQEEDFRGGMDIIDTFSVQLFTVPALVPVMIRRGGLLDVLINVLLNLFETNSEVVRPYDETIPYKQSAFANEYQTVLYRQRCRHSRDAASSSNAPNFGSRRQRYYLPIPFSTHEAHSNVKLMNNVSDGFKRQKCHGRDRSNEFLWNLVRSTIGSESRSRSQHESAVETENARNSSQPNAAEILARGPTEGESTEQSMSMEIEGHSAVGTDLPENMNVDTNRADDGELLVPDIDEDFIINPTLLEVFTDGQVVADDESDSDSGILTIPLHALDENGELAMLVESGEESYGRASENDSTHAGIQERLAVFRDGLSRLSSRTTGTSSKKEATYAERFAGLGEPVAQEPEQAGKKPASAMGALQHAVREARIMEESAILGTGPLAHTLRLEWPREQRKIDGSFISKVVNDLKYLLTHRVVAFHLVHVRKDLFRKLVRVLSMAQGMNAAVRKFGDHIVNETDSLINAFTIETEISFCVELLSEAFCGLHLPSSLKARRESDPSFEGIDLAASRLQCIQIVRSCLNEWLDREEALEARSVYKDESFSVSHAVSIHLPLHRFLAFMMHRVLRQDQIELETALFGGLGQVTVADACRIAKHPLRIFALLAQVRAGMWKRNGFYSASQFSFYQRGMISDWFIDLDLFLVQCCAVVIGPDKFIREAQITFQIHDLQACLEGFSKEKLVDSPTMNVLSAQSLGLLPLAPRKYMMEDRFERPVIPDAGNTFAELASFIPSLIEELFILIVRVASERGKSGLGEAQALRRKLLHQLCYRDRTYSQLSRVFSVRISNELDPHDDGADNWNRLNAMLQSIIADIGLFIEPKGMQQGRYKLRDELWREFDPFELHLSATERNTALLRQAAAYKGPEKIIYAIPSDNISERPTFFQLKDLSKLGEAVCIQEGLATLLLRRLLQNNSSEILSGALPAALHLVRIALDENAFQGAGHNVHSLAHPLLEGPRANAAFIIVCELHNMSKTVDSPVLSEILPVLNQILRRAGQSSDLLLREFVKQNIGDWVLGTRSQPNISTATTGERPGSEMKGTRRKQTQLRKEIVQKAALAEIQRQQVKFAQFIGVSGEDNDPPCKDKQKEHCVLQKNEIGAGENQRDLRESAKAHDAELSSVRATLTKKAEFEKLCALCLSDGNDDGKNLFGLIGYYQKTRVPGIAREQCGMPNDMSCAATPPHPKPLQGPHIDKNCNIGSAGGKRLDESFILNKQQLQGGVEAGESVHLFFCGHSIHIHCFDRYFSSLRQTRGGPAHIERQSVPNLSKLEFLCPVCRRLANVVFPLMTAFYVSDSVRNAEVTTHMGMSLSFDQWIQRCNSDFQSCPVFNRGEACPLSNGIATRCSRQDETRLGHIANRTRTSQSSRLLFTSRAKGVLDRFGPWSSKDVQTTTESAADVVGLDSSPHGSCARIPSVTITTAACAEIAARSIPWNDNPYHPSRKSLVILLQESRALVKLEPELHSEALCVLWTEIQSSHAGNLDPFVTVAFLFLLWPEPFTVNDAKRMVQLGLNLICSTLQGTNPNNPTGLSQLAYDILLYLRRCCTIISSYFEALAEPPLAAYDNTDKSYEAVLEETTALLDYLGIPKPSQLDIQSQEALKPLTPESSLLTFRPRRITLLKLPELYQTLLEELDGRRCTCCPQNRPRSPALCLVCGSLLCARSGMYDLDGLEKHALQCGNGIGVFLLLNFVSVMVVRQDRSSHWVSPYLDAHGEEDENLRRGKPLYLNQARYSALERLWLTHSFQ